MKKTTHNKSFHITAGITSLLFFSMTGCATLSKSECQQADWYNIGVNDGNNGERMNYITNHNNACSKHGISLDTIAWQRGRHDGLKSYCTAVNAYQVGREGSTLSPVCGFLTSYEQQKIKNNYSEGRHIYDFERRLAEYREEKEQLQKELNETKELLNQYNRPVKHRKYQKNNQGVQRKKCSGKRTSSNSCAKTHYKKNQDPTQNRTKVKDLSHKISELNMIIQKKEKQRKIYRK